MQGCRDAGNTCMIELRELKTLKKPEMPGGAA